MPHHFVPTVALCLPQGLYYSREVLHGIFDFVREHHPWRYLNWHGLNVWPSPDSSEVHGAIGMIMPNDFFEMCRKRRLPTVNVSEKELGMGTARVLPDNYAAGKMAAEYFLEKKFTNFAFSGCTDLAFAVLRGRGFSERLAQAGYKVHEQIFGRGKWPSHSLDPLPEIGDWLRSLPKPCAVFAYADDHALRILNECERVGLSVPEEIAVLGCDNDDIHCELAPVPISSVAFPLRRLGYLAAQTLQQLLDGKPPPTEALRLAPTGIATRRSTDIIAVKDMAVARAVRFIAAHASEPIDVGDVVRSCGASRRYLERRFNTLLGRTPKQEIQRKRIAIAKRLLAETLLPMAEVAEASGFSDAKMLCTVFRSECHMTPSQFRRTTRGQ